MIYAFTLADRAMNEAIEARELAKDGIRNLRDDINVLKRKIWRLENPSKFDVGDKVVHNTTKLHGIVTEKKIEEYTRQSLQYFDWTYFVLFEKDKMVQKGIPGGFLRKTVK